MKYIGRDLLTLLISLFILSSCENPDEIGLDVDPANQINSSLTDTSTIRSVTVRDDSLVTNGLILHPLGYLQDSEIGKTEANLATALTFPETAPNFGTAPTLDSAVLVLKYGDEFYGDPNSNLSIQVYQLNEKYNTSRSYYNTKTWNYKPEIIGNKTIKNPENLRDSILINDIVKGGADTMKLVPGQIRIPISSSFIQANFFNAGTANLDNAKAFNEFIKGLYITLDKNQSGAGGITILDLSAANVSGLDIYYKSDLGNGGLDTVVTHFGISNTSTAAHIKHDYIAAIQTQLDNPTKQFSSVYLQPMGGLRAKINFPYIDNLKALGNIIINKAELIITLDIGRLQYNNTAAPRLVLYRSDIADQRQPLPDNDFGQTKSGFIDPRILDEVQFGGFHDPIKGRYIFTITSYIQDILNGKLAQYDTFIAPIFINGAPNQNIFSLSTGSTATRAIVGGGDNSGYKMKLKIIYTKLN